MNFARTRSSSNDDHDHDDDDGRVCGARQTFSGSHPETHTLTWSVKRLSCLMVMNNYCGCVHIHIILCKWLLKSVPAQTSNISEFSHNALEFFKEWLVPSMTECLKTMSKCPDHFHNAVKLQLWSLFFAGPKHERFS